jgi:hypothetical protein
MPPKQQRPLSVLEMSHTKFMQSLDQTVYQELHDIATGRNISMQELIRAIVIPEWLRISEERLVPEAPMDPKTLGKTKESSEVSLTSSIHVSPRIIPNRNPQSYRIR